jgi:membrane associated rhomboid family serine protease
VKPEREKIINLPGVITGLLILLGGIEAIVEYGPSAISDPIYSALAFVPARLGFYLWPGNVAAELSGVALDPQTSAQISLVSGDGAAALATLLTYALLHGGWTHYFVNALTLAAFGAPVARRLGDSVFLLFLACCAIAGALTHFGFHPIDVIPVVGASAAISGAMAGIVRFAFTPGTRVATDRNSDPAAPLSGLARNRPAMGFVLVWFGSNALIGAFPQAFGSGEAIAWEAHIGGFLFGLATFGFFERIARRGAP